MNDSPKPDPVADAIQSWHNLQADHNTLLLERDSLKSLLERSTWELDKLSSDFSLCRSELEHYRLQATQLGTQLRNLRALTAEACLAIFGAPPQTLNTAPPISAPQPGDD